MQDTACQVLLPYLPRYLLSLRIDRQHSPNPEEPHLKHETVLRIFMTTTMYYPIAATHQARVGAYEIGQFLGFET